MSRAPLARSILLVAAVASTWPRPAGAGAPATTAVPATAPHDEPAVGLEVKVDPEMFQGEAHRRWVEERGLRLLQDRAEGLEPGDRIVVELGGMAYEYRVTVRALRRGVALEPGSEPFVVEGATEELLPRIDAAIEDAAARLVAVARAEAEAAERAEQDRQRLEREQAAAAAAAAADEARRVRQRAKTRAIRIAGASSTAVGGAALVGGIVLAALGPRDYEQDSRLQRTTRLPGFVVLGAGGAVLVAGTSVLVWNHLRCRRSPAACGVPTSTSEPTARRVVPWIGSTAAGASVVGWF